MTKIATKHNIYEIKWNTSFFTDASMFVVARITFAMKYAINIGQKIKRNDNVLGQCQISHSIFMD